MFHPTLWFEFACLFDIALVTVCCVVMETDERIGRIQLAAYSCTACGMRELYEEQVVRSMQTFSATSETAQRLSSRLLYMGGKHRNQTGE